jgi:hypothetical protein
MQIFRSLLLWVPVLLAIQALQAAGLLEWDLPSFINGAFSVVICTIFASREGV